MRPQKGQFRSRLWKYLLVWSVVGSKFDAILHKCILSLWWSFVFQILPFKVSHYIVHHSPLLDCMLFSLKIWPFTELTHAHLSVWLLFHIGIFMIAFIESWSNNWCSFGTFQPVFNWFINWETTKQQSPCLEAGLGEKSGNQGSSNTTILEWIHLNPPIHMHLFVTES